MRGRDDTSIQRLGVERDEAIILAFEELGAFRPLRDAEENLLQRACWRVARAESSRSFWTEIDDRFLAENFRNVPQSERGWTKLGQELDPPRSPFAVRKRMRTLGLRVSERGPEAAGSVKAVG